MATMIADTLEALTALQDIDRSIYALRSERANKPEALKALKFELDAINRRRAEAENELEAYRSKQRLLEGDVASHEDKIAALGNRLHEVKNNKEYQAILSDIENEKSSRRHLEERILETMEQIEAVNLQIQDVHGEIATKQERLDDEDQEVRSLIDEIDEELAELEKERSELLAPVPPEALATYEKLLQTTKGRALAAVEDHTCTECYSHLPLNLINRMHIGESFVTCPSCNRILYEH